MSEQQVDGRALTAALGLPVDASAGDINARLQQMGSRRMTFAQETRLFAAIGLTKAVPSPDEIVAAAEGQKRAFEAATTRTRELEAAGGGSSEIAQLRDEISSLRSQNRIAARERELDRRDEREERDYELDFLRRFNEPLPSKQAR